MSDDVVISKVIFPENKTNFLVTRVKPEPCDDDSGITNHESQNKNSEAPPPNLSSRPSSNPRSQSIHTETNSSLTHPPVRSDCATVFTSFSTAHTNIPPGQYSSLPASCLLTWPNMNPTSGPGIPQILSTVRNPSFTSVSNLATFTPILVSSVISPGPPNKIVRNRFLPAVVNPVQLPPNPPMYGVSNNRALLPQSVSTNQPLLPMNSSSNHHHQQHPYLPPILPYHANNSYRSRPPLIARPAVGLSNKGVIRPNSSQAPQIPKTISQLVQNPRFGSHSPASRFVSLDMSRNNYPNSSSTAELDPIGSNHPSSLAGGIQSSANLSCSTDESRSSFVVNTDNRSQTTRTNSVDPTPVASTTLLISSPVVSNSVGRSCFSAILPSRSNGPITASSTSCSSNLTCTESTDHGFIEGTLWNRAIRNAKGDLVFPGTGRLFFSSPKTVLAQIRSMALSDFSLSLQLPNTALDSESTDKPTLNEWLRQVTVGTNSKKGFHVCPCCRQTFSTSALYDSHLSRPVARIFYRCHLCRGSETAHLMGNELPTPTIPDSANFTSSANLTDLNMNRSMTMLSSHFNAESGSRFASYSILPGGIIRTTNKCAIFAHMAASHPTQLDSWDLVPSLLTINPLPDHTWSLISTSELHSDAIQPNEFENIDLTAEDSTHTLDCETSQPTPISTNPTSSDGQMIKSGFYQHGLELVEIWRDFHRTYNNTAALQNLDLDLSLNETTATKICKPSEIRFGLDKFPSLRRIYEPESDLSSTSDRQLEFRPCLPSPDSPLFRTILNLAQSEVWRTHLFLTDSCQSSLPDLNPLADGWTSPNSVSQSHPIRDGKFPDDQFPMAPTNHQLNRSLISLHSVQRSRFYASHKSNSLHSTHKLSSSDEPNPIPQLDSIQVKTKSPSRSTDSTASLSDFPNSTGPFRCLICQFRTTRDDLLKQHLCGSNTSVYTKCALCGLSVCINRHNLCSVKAHLLLHLGCYLMCPQCGFTPPAYLAPDAAELCLRVHLRFVCFHFNLLQVYQCTRCEIRGKACSTLASLAQHYFDTHVKTVYCCLKCCPPMPNGISPLDHAMANESTLTESDELSCQNGLSSENNVYRHSLSQTREPSGLSGKTGAVNRQSNNSSQLNFVSLADLTSHFEIFHPDLMRTQRSELPIASTTMDSDLSELGPNGLSTDNVPEPVGKSTLGALLNKMDYSVGFQCAECRQILRCRDSFIQHFSTRHGSKFNSEFHYRCFGSCRRLCSSVQEFRRHFQICRIAQSIYQLTFTKPNPIDMKSPGICQNSVVGSTESEPEPSGLAGKSTMLAKVACPNPMDKLDPRLSRICFCAYCGIGSRRGISGRTSLGTSSTSAAVAAATTTTTALLTPTESWIMDDHQTPEPNPTELVHKIHPSTSTIIETTNSISDDNPVDVRSPALLNPDSNTVTLSSSSSSCGGAPGGCSNKNLIYAPQFFPDLASLHEHENQLHYFETDSQIACPWCGERLTCSNSGDMNSHLMEHVRKQWFAAWQLERMRRWNENAKSLPHCMCGVALLDSPLAIVTHAASHLGFVDAMKSYILPETSQLNHSKTSSNRRYNLTDQCVFPGPRDHIPCLIEVYRHLRFAIHPELDHYLNGECFSSLVFPCPVCHSKFTCRWALTEHAFAEHWGSLCYICCTYLVPTRMDPPEPVALADSQPLPIFWPNASENPVCSSALPIMASATNTSMNTTVITTTTPNCTDTTATTSSDGIDSNNKLAEPVLSGTNSFGDASVRICSTNPESSSLWSHVYECMQARLLALQQTLQASETNPINSNSINNGDHPGDKYDVDDANEGDDNLLNSSELQIVLSPSSPIRNGNSSITGTKDEDRSIQPDVIMIDSSPDCQSPVALNRLPRSVGNESTAHIVPCSSTQSFHTNDKRTTPKRRLDYKDNEPPNPNDQGDEEEMSDNSVSTDIQGHDSNEPNRTRNNNQPTSDGNIAKPGPNSGERTRLCVLCGEIQTPDTWEDHSMSHRNPLMVWKGVQLTQPDRVYIAKRQVKIYRCYVCNRKFSAKSSCLRHMYLIHRMPRNEINRDSIIDNSYEKRLTSSSSRLRKRSRFSQSSTPTSSTSVMDSNSKDSNEQPIATDRPIRRTIDPLNPRFDVSQTNVLSDPNSFTCCLCQISFISQKSLSIHCIAAHGQHE